ncbi:putative bifunctional diguanylate cyclase/phosphodiesterase [Maritalea porphyrae]|uniref:EAL domain-containing protein n=1 Tax=Maritalea porphyrae TaxID=880732 RepID=A0ABQ5UNL3_9HYPH|nr:EAL domain-containing protein [Maritalea porphyrae]GLQ16886.1 hypothetical protein GCM10007879_11350 [Maritalea porphyrae]
MQKTHKRNWIISLGLFAIGVATIGASVYSAQKVMDDLLRKDAVSNGMSWAQHVADTTDGLNAVVSGYAPASDVEGVLGRLAAVGDIYQFAFISPHGELIFKTGSYHPPAEAGEAAHHAHSHDPAPQLGADVEHVQHDNHTTHAASASNTPTSHDHGAHAHDHAAPQEPQAHGEHDHAAAYPGSSTQPHLQHSTKLMIGDGETDPIHFAEVNHPVTVNGEIQYVIRLRLDQTERFEIYQAAVSTLSIILASIVLLAVGIPALLALRSRKQAELADQQVHFLARHDPLTGLLNRSSFLDQLEHAAQTRRGINEQIGLFIIDLDGFKGINDGFGHDVGDELLRQLADSLKFQGEDLDAIARLGGDEFAAFVSFDPDEVDLHDLANHTLASLTGIYEVNGHDVVTTASIGVALCPDDAELPAELMQKADIALYNVKTNGRNGYAFFERGMEKRMKKRRNMEALLRQARHDQAFELHFQPLFDQKSRALIAFETLVRMRDEKGEFVPPDVFIPVAEDMGMMEELGEFILREATKTAMNWPDQVGLAVNLSPKQFESGKLLSIVSSALVRSGLKPERLELEITESLLMSNSQRNLRQLELLKEIGVSIAMDDFGTGYSSLGYLWKFPFDKIKIDKSFLGGMENVDEKANQIVSTIIALGHTLEMCVTAEGVETEAQAEFLNAHKCDQLQGFLLGRPMPKEEIDRFILEGKNKKAELQIVS